MSVPDQLQIARLAGHSGSQCTDLLFMLTGSCDNRQVANIF